MRKATIILCTSLSLFLIIEQFGLWDSLLLFLLVGTVPGTSFSLPPIAMLASLSLLVAIGTLYLIAETPVMPTASKKTMPKKRYSRI